MRIVFSILLGIMVGNFILSLAYSNHFEGGVKPKRIIFELGRVYTICPPKQENPFVIKACHDVIISDTSGVYVKYFEVGSMNGLSFSRSCEDFQQLISNCK